MRHKALLLAPLLAGLPAPARADRLTNARGQPMAEVSHEVAVTIDGGVARYRVRRTFANSGVQAEEASLRIDLAHGAAATGLKIRARDRWYEGELMDAEEARVKYRELTGVGAWQPRDPALLQWVWADSAHLQVFPVLPDAVSTVEYTLTAPLEYRGGRYVITYPRPTGTEPDLPLATPVLRIEPRYGDATTFVRVAGLRVAPGAPIVLTPPPETVWIGEGEADPGAGHVFSKVEVPRDAKVSRAEVTLEIDHTYAGDLLVALIPPSGEHIPVVRGAGDGNDLRGTYPVDLPPGTAARGAWHLRVSDHAGRDVGTLDAWALKLTPDKGAPIRAAAADLPRFIPDAPDESGAGGHALIEVEPPTIATLDARLGRVVASATKGFTRVEIDAAPRIREAPRRASVVFVLDVSRSLPESDLAAMLRLVAAYAVHLPDATFELVAFDRRARRVLGDFVAARDLPDALARAQGAGRLKQGNGSALDEGLALAAAALQGRRGPRRIVALSDALLRARFRDALADAALAPAKGALMHLVIPDEGHEASLVRDEDHPLARLAARHDGVVYRAAAPQGDKRLPAVAEELVRPVAIDFFKIAGVDLDGAREVPAALREGTGYRAMLATPAPTREIVLTGKIWAAPFRRVVRAGGDFDAATAAFVFSEDEHHDLTHDEMMRVALAGRAVSPVTSYLAIEPGVRPSVAGLERDGDAIGLGGLGLLGHGGGGGGSGAAATPTFESLLARDVARCAALHRPPSGWRVALAIETTWQEVADVEARAASHPGMGECLSEAAWALDLPPADWPLRRAHTVDLR